jgi:hypothetical protein
MIEKHWKWVSLEEAREFFEDEPDRVFVIFENDEKEFVKE